jgi:predicted metalloprotease with PDZ domain
MPAWIPGSYMIRDFARNIVSITAHSAGESVALQKVDKQRWQAAPCNGPLQLDYTVYAWDLSVRSAHLDQSHAYFNGSSVFLAVEGQSDQACSLEILPPDGQAYQHWRLATTYAPLSAKPWQFGIFHAADYEELIDHPVEMGDFTLLEFEADGIPHAITLTGRHYADGERLKRDLQRICEYHITLFGEAPMERYLFQVMVVGDGYGGLEHRSSTSLLCSRGDLPQMSEDAISDSYRSFLGLCSHEYFHSWQVKRIKPREFVPYQLAQESYTTLLWAFEGFTAYYDDISLVRCGLITAESYLELLGQTITRVLRSHGRHKQTLAESSFDAWTKFYKQDENAPNAIISYYIKGSLVALALDLMIRQHSLGSRSLDDVMRRLWRDYGKPQQGIEADELERLIGEVSGIDLAAFFEQALRGHEDLPLNELLATVAVDYRLRSADNNGDKGGRPGKDKSSPLALGVRYGADVLGAKLLNVFDGGAAQQAGLSAGDVIIAVDGLRASLENIEQLLAWQRGKATTTVHAFRRDELIQRQLAIQAAPRDTCYLQLATEADADTLMQRGQWLSASPDRFES